MGVQVGLRLIRRDLRAQILCSLCAPKSRRPYTNICTRIGNAAHTNRIAIATPMTVPEGVGWIALGNHVYVRNIN